VTASISEQIMEAVATLFGGVGANGEGTHGAGPAGSTLFRSREAALALSEGTAVIIRPRTEPASYVATRATKRDLTLTIEILARGAVPDQVADAVRVAAHVALTADPTLGGLVGGIFQMETEWEFSEADQTAVSVKSDYRIVFMTAGNSLTTAA
jgi:hypothetical protein